jgi:hypothetical protein
MHFEMIVGEIPLPKGGVMAFPGGPGVFLHLNDLLFQPRRGGGTGVSGKSREDGQDQWRAHADPPALKDSAIMLAGRMSGERQWTDRREGSTKARRRA